VSSQADRGSLRRSDRRGAGVNDLRSSRTGQLVESDVIRQRFAV
jgi:hypothetical protein